MATVSVNYKFGNFRAKVAPNTVLNDVLLDSLRHYKLLGDGATNGSQNWTLLHNKKPVTLDLPWRFLNLSAGVNLDLEKSESTSKADESKTVKIKWVVSGHKTVVETIKGSADLKDVLDVLASKHGWLIDPADAKLQVFSKVVPYSETRGLTLDDLGVKDSALVRLLMPVSAQPAQQDLPQTVPTGDEQATEETKISEDVPPNPRRHELHKVEAFIPSDTPIAAQIQNEPEYADDYEMTVEQARRYQHMLQKHTGAPGGPLLTKRMRQEREQVAQAVVTECVVRVRFTDLTHLEVAFEPSESMETVYKIISASLIDPTLSFTLSQPHPFQLLPPDDRKLHEDLGFGTKTLLVFGCQSKGPVLKPEFLNSAKHLTDADDVKRDRVEPSETEEMLGKKPVAADSGLNSSNPKIKKIPKWLKLSKK